MTGTASVEVRGRLSLPVAEVFGPTIQGEGPYAGHRAMFVRLGYCNLSCGFCDTPYTWDADRFDVAAEAPYRNVVHVGDELLEPTPPPHLVVITGGEPLLHQRKPAFRDLVVRMGNNDRAVHVETNGTLAPHGPLIDQVAVFAVSPKLASSGTDPERRRIRPSALDAFAELAYGEAAFFKFVASSRDDLDEIDQIVADHQVPTGSVWVMPEGTDAETLLLRHRHLMPAILERGYNTTTRLHTLLWGDQRGR